MSGFLSYVKNSLIDYALCAIASSSLCYACLIAFLSTIPYRDSPWLIVLCCAGVSAVLFVVGYNLKTAVVGSVLLVVATFGAALALWAPSGAAGLFDDVVGNGALLVFMVVLCSVLVYVLSRRRALVIVLLVVGLLLCCVMEYLYWNNQIVAAVAYAVAVACLYAYRNYQANLMGSDSEQISFGSTTLASGAICLFSIGLAVGIFGAVVAPMNPPSLVVKLITRHVALQEEHVKGIGDELSVRNELLLSWNTDSNIPDSSTATGENPQGGTNEENDDSGDESQHTAGSSRGLDDPGDEDVTAMTSKLPDWMPVVIPFIVIALVALVIAARKLVRRIRYNRIKQLPANDRIESSYLAFLSWFEKMHMATPTCQTLGEYVQASSGEIGRFEQTTGNVEFANLTKSYERSVYGGGVPTPEDIARFDDYYAGFHRNARKFVGPLRYARLFFRI